jgi:hypothetical protein
VKLFHFDGSQSTEGIEKARLGQMESIALCDQQPPTVEHGRIYSVSLKQDKNTYLLCKPEQTEKQALALIGQRCELSHRDTQQSGEPYLIRGTYDLDQQRPNGEENKPQTSIWLRALVVIQPGQTVVTQDINGKWGSLKYTPQNETRLQFHPFETTSMTEEGSAHIRA